MEAASRKRQLVEQQEQHERVFSSSQVTTSSECGRPSKAQKVSCATEQLASTNVGQEPTVFVWDLDETLIIFQTLSTGIYTSYNKSKNAEAAVALGERWEELMLKVCDEVLILGQLESCSKPNVDSLKECDDGQDISSDGDEQQKAARSLRFLKDWYTLWGLGKHALREELVSEWNDLYEKTDTLTDGWLSAGRSILEACTEPSSAETSSCNVNVLVTSGYLVPTLVKCLLFKLNTFFEAGNIYSSRQVGKEQCFKWIKERFSQNGAKFCVIGDGPEECQAAEALQWPFVKVEIMPEGSNYLPSLTMKTIHRTCNYVG